MSKFIFIAGGARSGKSRLCVELARKLGKKTLFIATCVPQDSEMKKRISLHKKARPLNWKTTVAQTDIKSVLLKAQGKFDVVILDCLSLFLSNLLAKGLNDNKIVKEMELTAKAMSKGCYTAIVVSNETGEGIVPANPLARRFRDLLGTSNQIMAGYADTAYMMHVGIPTKIK